jgi:hypothetical protein
LILRGEGKGERFNTEDTEKNEGKAENAEAGNADAERKTPSWRRMKRTEVRAAL